MGMQQPERTYTFIDDPNHKQTLSGRVQAACLTCRKKKIKCSGEQPCRQCTDKRLVCEEAPSRKRPQKYHSPVSNWRAVPKPDPSNIFHQLIQIPALAAKKQVKDIRDSNKLVEAR